MRAGPGTFPEINEDVARQPQQIMGSLMPAYQPSPTRAERNRRTIYTFQKRSLIDPFLEVFNGRFAERIDARSRDASTVPTQVFALFNSEFVHDMALAFAARLENAATIPIDRSRSGAPSTAAAHRRQQKTRLHAHLRQRTGARTGAEAAPPRESPRTALVRSITSELPAAE